MNGGKLQHPTSNHQKSSRLQAPKLRLRRVLSAAETAERFGAWVLVLLWRLDVGCWWFFTHDH